MSAALELTNVDAGYGQFMALRNVSIRVEPGEAVALVGANGVGKTTVARVASGLVRPTAGRVVANGRDLTGRAPHAFVRAGIAHAPEGRSVFATLTVEENLRLGLYLAPRRWSERRDAMLAQFPVLQRLWRKRADDLSGGERKVVGVARALMMEPRVLLFDEPSAGLSPDRQDELFDLIRSINRTGVTVVIVEQNARQCLEICDRGYVLDRGANAFVGRREELLADEKVVALYLGRMHQGPDRS